jgi:hypothetical protein
LAGDGSAADSCAENNAQNKTLCSTLSRHFMVKNKSTLKSDEGKRVARGDDYMARILLIKTHYAYFCHPSSFHW